VARNGAHDPRGEVVARLWEIAAFARRDDAQPVRRLDLDVDVEGECEGQRVEPGTEVGRRSRDTGAHGAKT
jgi:hypothetical protein